MKLFKESSILAWFYPDEPNFFDDSKISYHLMVMKKNYLQVIDEFKHLQTGGKLVVSLSELPAGTPCHLDDEGEIITEAKPVSFSHLIIRYSTTGKSYIHIDDSRKEIEFCFTKPTIDMLIHLIQTSIEEHGTLHGNYLNIDTLQNDKPDILAGELVIWGSYNNKPIYY